MKYKMYDGTTVEVDARLKSMPNAQCGVIFGEHGATHFISYRTPVISIDPQGWLTCTGTYSTTTRKQIGRFLSEYAPNINYEDAKCCYELHKTINIYTREEADLA